MKSRVVNLMMFVLLSLSVTFLNAQDQPVVEVEENNTVKEEVLEAYCDEYKPYRWGVQFSPSVLQLKNLETLESDIVGTGYSVGLVYDRYLKNTSLLLNTGIGFGSYKVSYEVENLKSTTPNVMNNQVSYLEIPINLKYRTPALKEGVKGFGLVGATNKLLITGTNSIENTENGTEEVLESDLTKYNVGLNIGGGLEFSLPNCKTLTVGASYNKALLSMKTVDLMQLNTLQVQVGLNF